MTEEQAPKRRGRPPKSAAIQREPKRPMFKMQSEGDAIDPIDENTPDRFRIPPDEIPDDVQLQWVRLSIMGQPDEANVRYRTKAGWNPVCKGDIDGRFDFRFDASKDTEQFTVDGTMGLMWMPKERYKKIQARELRAAREQVSIKENMLKGGDIPISLDASHPSAINSNRISKSFERIDVPKD